MVVLHLSCMKSMPDPRGIHGDTPSIPIGRFLSYIYQKDLYKH